MSVTRPETVTAGLEAEMIRQSGNLNEKWTALYVRLSRDDENEGDSNSISHQIEILTRYCQDREISSYKVYKDDGWSGTNFKRPGFMEMMADIEAGLVSMVVVKDDCDIIRLNAKPLWHNGLALLLKIRIASLKSLLFIISRGFLIFL